MEDGVQGSANEAYQPESHDHIYHRDDQNVNHHHRNASSTQQHLNNSLGGSSGNTLAVSVEQIEAHCGVPCNEHTESAEVGAMYSA